MTDGGGFWNSAGRFIGSARNGVGEGISSTVEGIGSLAQGGWNIATDPVARQGAWDSTKELARKTGAYGSQVYNDPAKVYRDARDGVNTLRTKYDTARAEAERQGKLPEFYGNLTGRGGFEVGTALVPVGAATKLGWAGKGAKAVGTVAKGADKLGDAAKGTKAVGGLSKAQAVGKPSAAAKAVQKGTKALKAPVSVKPCPQGAAKPLKPKPKPSKAAPKKPPAKAKPAQKPNSKPKKAKTVAEDPYKRPSGYRKGVRDKVWNQAKGPDGKVRDPLTGKVIKKSDPWDMGHKPSYEARKHKASAQKRGISRKQYLDEHNNPAHYRPELRSSNRSHAGEDMTKQYKGP